MAAFYVQPTDEVTIDDYLRHVEAVERLAARHKDYKLLVMGDYNLPKVQWKSSTSFNIPLPTLVFETFADTRPMVIEKAQVICNSMAFLGLHQLFPVHEYKNYTLDLCFSNIELLEVVHSNDYLVVPDRHHPPMLLTIPTFSQDTILKQPVLVLDYKNANYEELNKVFSEVNWMDVLSSNDLDNSVSKFYDIVNSGIAANVPKCKCVNFSSTYPVWHSSELKVLIEVKKILHRHWKQHHNLTV